MAEKSIDGIIHQKKKRIKEEKAMKQSFFLALPLMIGMMIFPMMAEAQMMGGGRMGGGMMGGWGGYAGTGTRWRLWAGSWRGLWYGARLRPRVWHGAGDDGSGERLRDGSWDDGTRVREPLRAAIRSAKWSRPSIWRIPIRTAEAFEQSGSPPGGGELSAVHK
jgi:hypothetical protein